MEKQIQENVKTVNLLGYRIFCDSLDRIPFNNKIVINTINPHSYYNAMKDNFFHDALETSDILLPDGIGIVLANRLINKAKIKKIAGYDIFIHILKMTEKNKPKFFFLGSTQNTLNKIKERLKKEYPNVEFGSYSPPFKEDFSEDDNAEMINAIQKFHPDFLFVGMTAPKQEKWTKSNWDYIDAGVICNIGAVFDFYAGTTKRAPEIFIKFGFEWLHRSFTSTRLLKRTLISSPLFLWYMFTEYAQNIVLGMSEKKYRRQNLESTTIDQKKKMVWK